MNLTLIPPITEECGELFRFMNSKSLVPPRSGSLLWPVSKETEELAGRPGCANHSQRSFPSMRLLGVPDLSAICLESSITVSVSYIHLGSVFKS